MAIARLTRFTPEHILDWLKVETDPEIIKHTLYTLRKDNDYASRLNHSDPRAVICYALTTNDINSVSAKELKRAINTLGTELSALPGLVEFLNSVINYRTSKDRTHSATIKDTAKQTLQQIMTQLSPNNPYLNFRKINLKKIDFSGANLQLADFTGADLDEVNFSHAKLDKANLSDANGKDCNFDQVDLRTTDLAWSDLEKSFLNLEITNRSLRLILQTKCPPNIVLNSIPTARNLTDTLNELDRDLESDRLVEHDPISDMTQHKLSTRNWQHRKLTEENVIKIAKHIEDIEEAKNFITAALESNFFKNHAGSRFVHSVNQGMVNIYNLFHKKHPRKVDFFGSSIDSDLVKYLNELEKKFESESRKIRKP